MTSFTGARVGPGGIDFGLDFLHRHGLAGLGADVARYFKERALVLLGVEFALDEAGNTGWVEQTFGLGLGGDRFGQVQLDDDAHSGLEFAGSKEEAQLTIEWRSGVFLSDDSQKVAWVRRSFDCARW